MNMTTPTSSFRARALGMLCLGLLAVLLTSFLPTDVQAADVLYATGVGVVQTSALYTIDPSTGAATLAHLLPGIQVYAGGLVYDAATDTLYATGALDSDPGTSRLFVIDRFTGTVTYRPGMDPSINLTGGGLAIHPSTGVLYATGDNGFQSTALFTIDKATGAATFVGQNGGQCCVAPYGFRMYGLGFRSDGTLFANGFTLTDGSSQLFTVDLVSGLATRIGAHGVSVGRSLKYSGLEFGSSGTLYSLGSISSSADGLYSVDPGSGAATLIGGTNLDFGVDGGLAFAPDQPTSPVPTLSPVGMAILAAVLVGIGVWIERRMVPAAGPAPSGPSLT